MALNYKPVGGVKRVLLYPADSVETAIFSSKGCQIQFSEAPLEVELLEDKSSYEERTEVSNGVTKVVHLLQIVADRDMAKTWFEFDFLERLSIDGAIAVIMLADGRSLLAGYSSLFGDEQPLRLESLSSTSGSTLHDRPSVALQLVSCDTEFSCRVI